jgi:hypothetical protein
MFVGPKKAFSIDELSAQAEYFEQLWISFSALNCMQFEESVDTTIRNWLAAKAFVLCDALEVESPVKISAKKLSEQVIAGLDKNCLTSAYEVALEVVAKGVYFFTSAYPFLSTMHKLGIENPNINARSAATLAAVDYIGEYIFTLVNFKKD